MPNIIFLQNALLTLALTKEVTEKKTQCLSSVLFIECLVIFTDYMFFTGQFLASAAKAMQFSNKK